jgi:RND superfamily putative drug exporter
VIILLFAFGTATAMFLPIATAVLGLVTTLSTIKLLGHVVDVPSVAPTLATMIGLGVGIDYALFIVTRHKMQLGRAWRCASRWGGPRPRPAGPCSSPAPRW